MFKNYLKIAGRNLKKNKGYAVINIGGLAIAMTCSILILLWVQSELSYDKFHRNADQIYRLTGSAKGGEFKFAVSPAGMAEGLRNEMPEIIATARLSKPYPALFEINGQKFEEQQLFYADSNFPDMFTFPLIEGNAETALQDPNSILITETTAKKYFGNTSALGKTIIKDNVENFTVTGVMADIPSNSHLRFNIILPMSNLAKINRDLINKSWGNFNFYTYLLLDKTLVPSSPNYELLTQRINKAFLSRNQSVEVDFQLQALTDIHLYSDLQIDLAGHGNIQYVNIFFIVACIILIVACINFMNLSTARYSHRAKEVGLRKVIGAKRQQLIFQFLSESLLISFIALLMAVIIVFLAIPGFNDIVGKQLDFSLLDGRILIGLLAITLLTGFFSGSYPALLLSGFKPVRVLKGKIKLGGGGLLFRNSLVITQFIVSVLLLVSTTVIYVQLNYIKDKSLGFNRENLLYIPMKGEIGGKREALKDALSQNPLTSNFTIISDLPIGLVTGSVDVQWEGKDPNAQIIFPTINIDENFLEVFKMETLRSQRRPQDYLMDDSQYIINEKAMHVMGMDIENVIGKNITFDGKEVTIVAVVKDFNYKPLQYPIEPLILRLNSDSGIVVVRTTAGNTQKVIGALENIYRELNPAYPLTYNFIDRDLENQYRGEQQMGVVFNLFALLSIFISCLGLYGLSAYLAEQRIKEIGIRKVLGASVGGLVNMLSKDFFKLIFIAFIVATPLAWYIMHKWLQGFAFHITIKWWMFAGSGIILTIITLITIGHQTIRTANTNPVKSLRTE